jgi:hypothetical protein
MFDFITVDEDETASRVFRILSNQLKHLEDFREGKTF